MSRNIRQKNKSRDTYIKKNTVVNEIESKLSLGEWVGAVTTLIVELVLGVNWIKTVALFLVPDMDLLVQDLYKLLYLVDQS